MGKIKSWMMQNNLIPNDDQPYNDDYPIGYANFDDYIDNNLEQYLNDLEDYYINNKNIYD